ncbi:hypothetical protein Mpal_2281 [Methanosphaerula palustris E1-9c]|uniref:DZANK-type domain-containing protein n=1 Tax=Methanosphaerula palustris (strain ATCC BAA-1556 / DSM 19958 / E1-9c) TaxID=521011 RepID=B8GE67_METPE|nr:hypothetical protein Mpal_2281 [Methanosphaerula palustris E1-9c]
MRRCTHCNMEIQPDVTICPYCFNAVEATKRCVHCGTPIRQGDRTCRFCNAIIPTRRIPDNPMAVLLATAKDPIAERERHPIRSNPFLAVYLLIVVVIASFLLWQVYIHLGPGQTRMELEGVLKEVSGTIPAPGENLTGSEAAAVTAWSSLNKTGVPVRIRFGSLVGMVQNLTATDRAWVMAEVEPGHWIAGDPVTGQIMEMIDHPLYYRGWDYTSPTSAQESLARLTRYQTVTAAIAAGTATTAELHEQSLLASDLARESGNLTVAG